MYKMHYTGFGYPTKAQIDTAAKAEGFTHSFWATDYGFRGSYNGDTVVVYNTTDNMPDDMKVDAQKYGRQI